MATTNLSHDEKWPRAHSLFSAVEPGTTTASELALVGIPASLTSLSPTSAHLTPRAIRQALARYSTFAASTSTQLIGKNFVDLGDIAEPDYEAGEERVRAHLSGAREAHTLLIALGGDNSITYSVVRALWSDLSDVGVITLDAHHDLRDGESNGSPIWRLLQAGVKGENIVQIGISDFANSEPYTQRAYENGITVIDRAALRQESIAIAIARALEIAGRGGREIYVDIDVDVCDRSVAPACPASVPGGISADELRQAARLLASDPRVRAIDITEIDAALDTPDQRTIRLAALLVLEAAAGVASR